jgi:chromosome segregation ATPase
MELNKKQAAKPPVPRSAQSKTGKPKSVGESSGRELIYYSSNGMDGTGLWCTPTDKPSNSRRTAVTASPSSLTSDVDVKVNSELVAMLEKKCSHLIVTCEKLKVERTQISTELQQVQAAKDRLEGTLKQTEGKLKQAVQRKELLEGQFDEQCITQNYAQTEIESLVREIDNERKRAESYKALYDKEAETREDESTEYEQELEALRQEMHRQTQGAYELITELESQNSALQQALSEKMGYKSNPEDSKEEKAKSKTARLNLTTAENRALTLKVKEMEEARNKNHEFLRKKDEDIRDLKAQVQQLAKRVKQEQELKKHQSDLVEQRDSRLRMVQDKFSALEREYQLLLGAQAAEVVEVKKTPKKLQEIVPVAARPDLFA